MGGRGSGRTSGYGFFVDKCEDYLSIDIAWLKRQGSLTPGNSGNITWSRNGKTTGSIGLDGKDSLCSTRYLNRVSSLDQLSSAFKYSRLFNTIDDAMSIEAVIPISTETCVNVVPYPYSV